MDGSPDEIAPVPVLLSQDLGSHPPQQLGVYPPQTLEQPRVERDASTPA